MTDPITPERVTLTEGEALAKFMQDQWLNGVIFDPSPEGGPPKINWQEYAERVLSHLSDRLRAAGEREARLRALADEWERTGERLQGIPAAQTWLLVSAQLRAVLDQGDEGGA